MAEIEIIYREGYCECDCMGTEYNTQCHTDCAGDLGCEMFNKGKHEKMLFPLEIVFMQSSNMYIKGRL